MMIVVVVMMMMMMTVAVMLLLGDWFVRAAVFGWYPAGMFCEEFPWERFVGSVLLGLAVLVLIACLLLACNNQRRGNKAFKEHWVKHIKCEDRNTTPGVDPLLP